MQDTELGSDSNILQSGEPQPTWQTSFRDTQIGYSQRLFIQVSFLEQSIPEEHFSLSLHIFDVLMTPGLLSTTGLENLLQETSQRLIKRKNIVFIKLPPDDC